MCPRYQDIYGLIITSEVKIVHVKKIVWMAVKDATIPSACRIFESKFLAMGILLAQQMESQMHS